jgi:hypothetical protein
MIVINIHVITVNNNIPIAEFCEHPPTDPYHQYVLQQAKSKSISSTESVSRFADCSNGKPSKKSLERTRKMLANMKTV